MSERMSDATKIQMLAKALERVIGRQRELIALYEDHLKHHAILEKKE